MSMVLVDKRKLKKALRDCVETGYIRGHCDTVENAFNLQYDMVSYEIVEALEHENGPVSSLSPIPADGLIEAAKKAIGVMRKARSENFAGNSAVPFGDDFGLGEATDELYFGVSSFEEACE